jgi:glutamate--cysteine ligase
METMDGPLERRLAGLPAERLAGMRRGIEKESLRTRPDGALAFTPHPARLGAPLTHPSITTDFSESQVELITGVHGDAAGAMQELQHIHQATLRAIGDEMLWAASMPCLLPADGDIPIGQYGTSNIGRAKTVYRTGLSHRYGSRMQTISGIHYNWSLPGTSSDDYFALMRNFRRHSFLLLLLFGASPAVCESFVAGVPNGLQTLAPGTLGLPHATSLRMGRLGYQSDAQASLAVSYNGLDSYGASLQDGLTRVHPPYEAIGIVDDAGRYRQLSTTLLQVENEFYSTVRPKRVIRPGERPLHALRERGVEYIEVRCMDLDPFEPVGIAESTMRFIDVFLLHCLLSDSPPDTPAEIAALARNQERVAARGREPGLRLLRGGDGGEVAMTQWAQELLDAFERIARALDALHGGASHRDAVAQARAGLAEPQRLPSARLLHDLSAAGQEGYVDLVRRLSSEAKRAVLALPWDDALAARFDAIAAESKRAQAALEASDRLPFESWRQHYLSVERLVPATAPP